MNIFTSKLKYVQLPAALLLAICIALGGCLAHLAYGQSWPETSGHAFGSDDAFISYRYAENLVNGNGLVYNPGERVEGYSNLGYTLLIAAGLLVIRPEQIYYFSFTINLLAFWIAIFYFWKLAKLKLNPHLAGLATVLFSMFPPFYQAVASGLETPFVLAGQIALLYYVFLAEEESGFPNWKIAITCVFLVLIRADGFVFAAFAPLYFLLKGKLRPAIAAFLVTFSIFCILEIWRMAYYGYPLPNTYYDKVDGNLINKLLSVLWQLIQSLPQTGILPFVFIAFAPVFFLLVNLIKKRKVESFNFLHFFGVMTVLYWIWIGGDVFLERFLLICVPIAILSVFISLAAELQAGKEVTNRIIYAVVILFVVFDAVPLIADARFSYSTKEYDMFRELGAFLGEKYPGKVLAVDAAGKIPFYSGLRTIDMLGLTDVKIAHSSFQTIIAGHNKYDPDYVLSREPDLIVSWIGIPSFDMVWGMSASKYLPNGYCLKYLIYPGRDKRADWIVAPQTTSESADWITRGWTYGVLEKSNNCFLRPHS